MNLQRLPVFGYDNFATKKRLAEKEYGHADWEENPDYHGPQKLTDNKGLGEIRGWLVVDADNRRNAIEILASIEAKIQAANGLLSEAAAIARELLGILSPASLPGDGVLQGEPAQSEAPQNQEVS